MNRTPTSRTGRTAVSVSGLSKSFAGEQVLDGVDLAVESGEFCAIVGPSGSGKSTLLKCIAGLVEPDEGQVHLRGEDVAGLPVADRDLGFVFQEFEETLFPHRTVAENVAFGLEQRGGLSSEAIDRRVDEMLELLAISETRDDYPPDLSGGQQQRVELARQLVRECDVVLLDDPLADLDYKLQKRMELELRRLHAEMDDTFVYVTHNQEQVLKLADTLAVLNDGRIEQAGPPEEVYERPETAFVARFVGDSNMLTGPVSTRDGDEVVVETAIGDVTATSGDDAEPGSEVVVTVRPEAVAIGEDDDNSFRASVEDRTYTGEWTEYVLSVPAGGDDPVSFDVLEPGETTVEHSKPTVAWDTAAATALEQLSVTETVTVEDLWKL